MKTIDMREDPLDSGSEIVKLIWGCEEDCIIFDPEQFCSKIFAPEKNVEISLVEREIDTLIATLEELKKLYESHQ